MRRFDVCNGDADGLCAVLQWRLAHPAQAALVTGLKRELELLHQVPAEAGDEVLVCDLSMQRNHAALLRLLDAGVQVRYVDHHKVDQVPQHAGLQACIDFDPRVCTSLLMDRLLRRLW
jgi:oligoribonuclease NrnB/cAMP/cGMP phosphodiesterase (DHH superfamily)